VTTLVGQEAGELVPWSDTAHEVAITVGALPPVDLPTLEAGAALLTRVDRKYVVPLATFERLVRALGDEWSALEIDGRRLFGYASVYFDSPDLLTYRAHLQGRRRRYKVRVRRYVDSDDCMLEVKHKGLRGRTVKQRQPHAAGSQTDLGDHGRSFVLDCLRSHGEPPVATFAPVVATSNRRATLTSLSDTARLTVDTDLTCGWNGRTTALRDGHVVLESKVEGHASTVDRVLRALGERPVAISKYCVGVASLDLGVPTNPWRRTLRTYFDTPHT
jgi:hypothetical protein